MVFESSWPAAAIAEFARDVRESSLKRFRLVRQQDYGWSERPDLLSFVDVLQHLVDADRWLFAWLDGRGESSGVTISPGDANPARWDSLLEELALLGVERTSRIAALASEDLACRQFDLGRRGIVGLPQLILRCNIDHEIHHRGALQLALRLRYG